MTHYKDRALAMRTIAALFRYRVSRVWDSLLIALLSLKAGLLPSRTRSAEPVRGDRLGMIAVLATAATSLMVQRSGQGDVPRP
ncbi:hypothetical protein ABTY96_13450 [Streptomyces sp. NPDC096057]|uniref:hypothetical protein n=1 Tax=Streptomyces sp. NPDC096057 TaxID=3155543 RepID=UPI003320F9EE